MTRTLIVAWMMGLLPAVTAGAASPFLVVHEWGTFTSFQDSDGTTIAGINVDDEPVPPFVHRLENVPIFSSGTLPATWSQGAPSCHPDVTLRLETPVLYFYPPAKWPARPFDVKATFVGGSLTEFYPTAIADSGGLPKVLDAAARGSLLWKQVSIDPGAQELMPKTTSQVWLAPREVRASIVSSPETREAEKYLFYRGVGHVDAPIVVREKGSLLEFGLRGSELTTLPRLWLVEVLPHGRVRYQTLNPTGRTAQVAAFPADSAGATSGLDALRREMGDALTAQGLFADESAAMLETWRLSYFESEGLRVFFALPRAWTDAHLPLSISTPTDVTRVMVGRIELVSAHQRKMLAKLQRLPESALPRLPLYAQDQSLLRTRSTNRGPLSMMYRASGVEVPESLAVYESLGRFRDALLTHEIRNATDESRRARLQRVLGTYGACVPMPPESLVSNP
jgi:hypothetical protein